MVWTGVLWLLYEYSNDEAILNIALKNVESFIYRIDHQIELDHRPGFYIVLHALLITLSIKR